RPASAQAPRSQQFQPGFSSSLSSSYFFLHFFEPTACRFFFLHFLVVTDELPGVAGATAGAGVRVVPPPSPPPLGGGGMNSNDPASQAPSCGRAKPAPR